MATQVTLGSGVIDSASGLKLRTNGTTEAVDVSTAQVVTLAKDAVVNGLTVGKGAGSVSTNTAVGASALAGNSTGARVTAVGYNAGIVNTGSDNLFVGHSAGSTATSGANNTFVGRASGPCINTSTASNNDAFGYQSLFYTSSGTGNSAIGAFSLNQNTTGSYNVTCGNQALFNNTTASNNTAVGYQAGYSNTTGLYNTFLGNKAGYTFNTSGDTYNTFIGNQSGYSVTTGTLNTFVGGANPGYYVTTGSKNTILGGYTGNQGGLDIRTANNYIVLSDGDGNPRIYNEGTYTNFGNGSVNQGGSIRLQDTAASGYGPVIVGRTGAIGATTDHWFAGSNSAIKGGTTYSTFTVMAGGSGGVNLTSGATSWTSASDERLKDIIEPISDAANKVSTLRAVIGKYKTDEEGTRRSFLIAQDVQSVLPEAVTEGRNSKEDETEYLQVAYTEVIPLLVAAIKELKAEIDQLKGQS